jgi:hypothetical protein
LSLEENKVNSNVFFINNPDLNPGQKKIIWIHTTEAKNTY